MSGFKKFIVIFVVLLAVAAIAVGTVFAIEFTKGGTTGLQTFYVKYNGKRYFTDNNTAELKYSDDGAKIEVKYLSNTVTPSKLNGYTVEILPYVDHDRDYEFVYGGETYKYTAAAALTESGNFNAAFNIKYYDDYFTIDTTKVLTAESVLSELLGKDIVMSTPPERTANVFVMVITSYNKNATVSIAFHRAYIPAGDIVIDPDKVVL